LVSAIADASTNEDAAYSYNASANFNDVDAGDTLTYTMSGNPSWLTINAGTGVLSGTPTNDDIAVSNVMVTATDTSSLAASDTYALTVVNVNDAPTLAAVSNKTATEDGANTVVTLVGADVDAGTTLIR